MSNNSGASLPALLAGRVGTWSRRVVKGLEPLKCFRVCKGDEILADFDPGPEAADEIGDFASNVAECAGGPVTLEIHAIVVREEHEISVRSMMLRAVPAPAALPAPPADAALAVVLSGYQQLQKQSVEMLSGVVAALRAQGDLMSSVLRESQAREATMREELSAHRELASKWEDVATRLEVAGTNKSTREKVEELLIPELVGRLGRLADGLVGGAAADVAAGSAAAAAAAPISGAPS